MSSDDITLVVYSTVLLTVLIATVYLIVEHLLPAIGIGRAAPPPPLPPLDPQEAQHLRDVAARMRVRRVEAQDADDQCIICLGEFDNPIEAIPCGHLFDSDCFVALIETGRFNNKCPTCRSQIDLVVPCFRRRPPQEPAEQTLANFAAPLRRYNNNANRNFDGGAAVMGRRGQALLQFAWTNFNRLPRRIRGQLVALLIFGISYLISPYDLISEGVAGPLIGYLDDVIVILIISVVLFAIVRNMFL
jgi:uncharacterized membrane protein YkvA (DUF1232 family)